jgi:hypothetical protein
MLMGCHRRSAGAQDPGVAVISLMFVVGFAVFSEAAACADDAG